MKTLAIEISTGDRISAEIGTPRSAEDDAAYFQGKLNETMVEFKRGLRTDHVVVK